MNVTEIEKQNQTTAINISKIEEKLEELPWLETDSIKRYEEEKKARLKLNVKTDHVKDREEENRKLFRHALFLGGNDQMTRNTLKRSEIRCESRQFTGRR